MSSRQSWRQASGVDRVCFMYVVTVGLTARPSASALFDHNACISFTGDDEDAAFGPPFGESQTSSTATQIQYPILFLLDTLSIELSFNTTYTKAIKMSGQGEGNITDNRRIVPSSPFEIQATQDLLQKRIENGMCPSFMGSGLTKQGR